MQINAQHDLVLDPLISGDTPLQTVTSQSICALVVITPARVHRRSDRHF